MHASRKVIIITLAIVLTVFVADRATKMWAANWLFRHGPVDVIPGCFSFRYAENTGIAFGLLQQHQKFVQWMTPVVFIGLIIFFFKTSHAEGKFLNWQVIAFGLVLGGALGNLYDRLRWSVVIDFLDCYIIIDGRRHTWPTFNIADSCICVGVTVLLITSYIAEKKMKEAAKDGS